MANDQEGISSDQEVTNFSPFVYEIPYKESEKGKDYLWYWNDDSTFLKIPFILDLEEFNGILAEGRDDESVYGGQGHQQVELDLKGHDYLLYLLKFDATTVSVHPFLVFGNEGIQNAS